jgi:hypothetical protein
LSRSRLLKLLEYLTAILLASLLAGGATAQQEDESTAETAETSASENASVDDAVADDADDADDVGEAAADAEDGVDTDLDEQTYEEDDDDFIPTEEIPADEPIPFPSNI